MSPLISPLLYPDLAELLNLSGLQRPAANANSPIIQWIIPDWGALLSVYQRGSRYAVKKVLRDELDRPNMHLRAANRDQSTWFLAP
jgi:hypothetical protein